MKCPYCGGVCADDALYCPSCKQPLPTAREESEARQEKRREKRTAGQKALTAVLVVLFLAGLSVGAYKLVSWNLKNSCTLIRPLANGDYAIGAFNLGDDDGDVVASMFDMGLPVESERKR